MRGFALRRLVIADHATLAGWLTRPHLTAIRDQLDSLLHEAARRERTPRETLGFLDEREIARREELRRGCATEVSKHFVSSNHTSCLLRPCGRSQRDGPKL
jgi:hypothetical protein